MAGQSSVKDSSNMRTLSIRIDDALHRRLRLRAYGANLSVSEFLRPLIEDAAVPGGRYAYTGQDELLGVALQTYALLAEMAAQQSGGIVERALAASRAMLRERGLLDPEEEVASGMWPTSLRKEGRGQ